MGVESKKKSAPPLPAPTESGSITTTPTELATDVSRPGDEKSSYSLPEDGTPVTIKTRGHRPNRSQTSLLIEYFEGGKAASGTGSGGDRKPSVRVRLTPSKNRRNDHIQITETKSTRKASLSRRSAPLSPGARYEGEALSAVSGGDVEDAKSMSSYASATEESNVSRNPIDIEIDRSGPGRRRQRPASPLIPTAEGSKASYQPPNMSEISAIPTDSFLDGSGPSNRTPEGKRSGSPSRAGDILAGAAAGLAAAAAADKVRNRSRNESRERERERVVGPKSKDREKSERKHKSSKSRTSSVSEKDVRSPRRRSSRGQQESVVSAADSSMLSSQISPSHRSMDQHSIRSGTSRSSINNPKLLETVEDAIRRLILPELDALKREQSRHKDRDRRGSVTSSGTSVSRDEYVSDRRRSSGVEKHVETPRDNLRSKEHRDREARHDLEESPAPSVGHESVDEIVRDFDSTPRRSSDKLKAAAAGAALGAAAAAMLHDKSPTEDKRQRRRRRAELRGRGSDRFAEELDEEEHLGPAPPMPLMSEINPSEVTRTSILSAESDRPHSASEEQAHDDASSPTPTRSPVTLQVIGAQHANVSHGDLKALPRERATEFAEEYETDEYGQKIQIQAPEEYEEEEYDEAAHDPLDYSPAGYGYYPTQDVPPPLKYVPYQPERRGLSPIPSVSGYTEGGSEQPNRDSKVTQTTTGSYSSPEKSPYHHDAEVHSPSSIPSNVMSREFGEDDRSHRSSGLDYRNTDYADDSEVGRVTSGQAVRAVGANPNFVHPIGVESAVASLVDGSVLDESILTGGSGYDGNQQYDHRDSMAAMEGARSGHATPTQESVASQRDLAEEDRDQTPMSRSQNSREFAGEYDVDEYGHKVPRSRYRESPTASEAAITGAAVGAAAAALKAAKDRRMQPSAEEGEEDFAPPGAGVVRNKSFKERTMDGQRPANTPTHSVDRLVDEYEQPRLGTSGVPDLRDPMPEIGYFGHDDDDLETNPSVVEERLAGTHHAGQERWQEHPSRGQEHLEKYGGERDMAHRGSGNGPGLGITEAAGAAAVATAAALASSHSRQASQEQEEEWQRTSDDRKRDTLVTNPYEGASPIVNLPGVNDNLLGGPADYDDEAYGGAFGTRSPLGPKVDEGYISQGPNKTPDMHGVKGKGVGFDTQPGMTAGDDPFYTPKHSRHLSGLSQGMASPFYDAATGTGIDRIESKDIIALMQHLMVRDAQRSARDTEILVTLVRSAAEMRNSFEDIKKMLADTEDVIITEVKDNTEKTVRNAIGGPRPFPGSGARSLQGGGSQGGTVEDLPQKKRNLFRRALKGLSSKGANDLTRIEEMLMQLLTEVDTLKSQSAPGASTSNQGAPSYENLQPEVQYEQDRGYEPEGNAGTSTASHASQSGHLSIPQSRGPSVGKLGYDRKFSDHRISTVPEANEDEFDHQSANAQTHYSNPDMLGTADPQDGRRGSSVPLGTPPQPATAAQTSHSNENTPKTDKGKKHGSWLPKISRWSETTTSSVAKAFRSSGRKDNDERNSFPNAPSRSGSDLGGYEEGYARTDPYGEDKLHSGFSEPEVHAPGNPNPSPTHHVSPVLSMTPEDPKYKAHRNSLNLQHPQPRQGQSERFKVALESQAQDFDSPMSPKSADWAGSATSLGRFPQRSGREDYGSGAAAVAQSQRYWSSSPGAGVPAGPPRPPKEPLEDHSNSRGTPPKSNRISQLQKGSPLPYHSVESGYGTATHGAPSASYTGSPRLENRNLSGALGVPTRRPSGPRAMTPKSAGSAGDEGDADARRRKRDTFGTISSQESETF